MDRMIAPKSKWKIRLIYSSLTILLLMIFVYAFTLNYGGRKLKISANNLMIDTVRFAVFQDFIAVSALVIPYKTVYIEAADGGRVEEVFTEDGAVVKAGQPLLRLSNPQMLLDVMNREAEYSQQLNNLEALKLQAAGILIDQQNRLLEVELELNRQKRKKMDTDKLFDAGMISKNDWQTVSEELEYLHKKHDLLKKSISQTANGLSLQQDQLKSAVANLKSNLTVIKKIADNLLVKAPSDGQLGGFDMQLGQSKSRGERLGMISQTTKFKLQTSVDEFYLPKIQAGLVAEALVEEQNVRLKVSKVYPEVKNSSVKVELEFLDSVHTGLKSGQSLNLKIFLNTEQDIVQIKNGPFYQVSGGNWIYVLTDNQKNAHKRTIKIGRSNPVSFEILSGLQKDEKVIISGYDGLDEADELIIEN